ncbi:unnamed protein product [Rangifer tarandus platyrhynchus]|uniref:Uncharacterized protein n=1 Tax=Rangifer tarandus platyrhynchus TaxID=3082113 RepID=A0AC59ZSR2_RANTA
MLGPQQSSEETPTAVPLPEVPPGDLLSGHLRLPEPVLLFPEAPWGCKDSKTRRPKDCPSLAVSVPKAQCPLSLDVLGSSVGGTLGPEVDMEGLGYNP